MGWNNPFNNKITRQDVQRSICSGRLESIKLSAKVAIFSKKKAFE